MIDTIDRIDDASAHAPAAALSDAPPAAPSTSAIQVNQVIHPELQAVLDEHQAPTHASQDDLRGLLVPIVDAATKVQQQLLQYRRLLVIAETAPHDTRLDGKLEHVHQTLGALEREAAALVAAARQLVRGAVQWDRYLAELPEQLANLLTEPM